MIKLNKKLIITIALIVITVIVAGTTSFAFNPDEWDPSKNHADRSSMFYVQAGKILGVIEYAGVIIAVLALTIIGLKYMFGSVEGKAEYKKAMLPYILGCFMLVGISIIIKIVQQIVGI